MEEKNKVLNDRLQAKESEVHKLQQELTHEQAMSRLARDDLLAPAAMPHVLQPQLTLARKMIIFLCYY